MNKTRVLTTSFVVVLAAAFAVLSASPATAEKPEPVISTAFAPNADCSVDFEITINSRGQMPSLVVVHYWQRDTQNGANYQYLASIDRGGVLGGTVDFTAADPSFGAIYDVGYTAFARSGRVVGADTIGSVDAAACV